MIYGFRIEMKVPERRRVTRNDRSVALIPVYGTIGGAVTASSPIWSRAVTS
jgi:hypothetical protein